jgi:hypothetical protein
MKILLNIIKHYKVLIKYLNKHFYILPLLALFSKVFKNKYYKISSLILKLIIILNIIVGTGLIIYFTDINTPLNTTFSLYSDLLRPYLDYLINLWNDLRNFSVEESLLKEIKESNNIKIQVKEGIKEAIDEILVDLNEKSHNQANSEFYKQIALISSVLLFGYFFFALPGPSISPEALTEYNWLNQS